MPSQRKLSHEDVKDVLIIKCNKELQEYLKDKEKDEDGKIDVELNPILLKAREIIGLIKIHKNKDVSYPVVKNIGICEKGYFPLKYDSIAYNSDTDNKKRGIVLKPFEFLKKMSQEDKYEIPESTRIQD